jgi:hypothetical protein
LSVRKPHFVVACCSLATGPGEPKTNGPLRDERLTI